MRPRHRARQLALRVVFQLDQAPGDWHPAFAYHLAEDDLPPESAAFAEELVALVQEHRVEIDSALQAAATHWSLEQMGRVERGVLRLGAAELLWRRQDPQAVTLDEAVGLAKELGGEDAARFVNGVLGRLAREAV